ncbi:MAG: cytochrome c oxidase subunit II [Alphaproteobacteria bacterium]|nr:cytochrome c oxidase subunit II [Alphaproteobacteria bacterium]
MTKLRFILASLAACFSAPAMAETVGLAEPWQLGFQQAATPVMERLNADHNLLLVIITAITLFVLALLVVIIVKFNRKANPVPSKTAHNTKLEIIWTVVPIIILVVIAIPSLRVHYFMEDTEQAEMDLKVTGYQWYWGYKYPTHGGFEFESRMIPDKEIKEGQVRLLSVDNPVVVPVDTKVRVLLTGADVIHSWAMPAFGVKRDAMPGRLNETWFKATRTGTFYGQCSELCGVGHGFMPIEVRVVSKEDFASWVSEQQKKAGIDPAALKPAEVTVTN